MVLKSIRSCKNAKCSVLSKIARCYDPLGLVGPTITKAKSILQRLWRDKLQRNESWPQSLETACSEFCKEVSEVRYVEVPHYILQSRAIVEVHAFCVCIYARSVKKGEVKVHLICAKSRLAPLFSLTVPKLKYVPTTLKPADILSMPLVAWSQFTA